MTARPFRLTRPIVGEHPFQAQVASVLRLEIAPAGRISDHGVVWYSIDHADYAGSVPGIRVGRGVVAGIPDVFLLYSGISHFIELKRLDGILSDGQRALIVALAIAGGRVGAANSVEQVIECLDTWGIPRTRRTKLVA